MSDSNSQQDDLGPSQPIPLGGDGNQNPSPVSGMMSKRFYLLIVAFLLFFMLRNIFFTDYKDETRTYLKKIGRSDAIDYVSGANLLRFSAILISVLN